MAYRNNTEAKLEGSSQSKKLTKIASNQFQFLLLKTSMACLASLAEINNQGCESLDHGDVSNAMLYFRRALAHAKSFLREAPREQNTVYRSRNILPMPTDITLSSLSSKNNYQNLIQSQAIRMVNGFVFSKNAFENSKIYISILIFNLALTSHLQGLILQSYRHFAQAKSLYHRALHLMAETVTICYEGRATGNEIVDLLTLGLFNNMALLHLEFSEYPESKNVFQRLIRYATSVPKNQFIDRLVHCFLLNATILGLNPPVAAAAA
jgi:tetratricopeptide (TPR) repeat protein